MKVIGYRRVSSQDQSRSGHGMDAQREAILGRAAKEDWDVEWIEDEGVSAKTIRKRPGLQRALASLKAGQASVLVVAKLDRLSRSVKDFMQLMEDSAKQGWEIVVLDFKLDTTTANGRMHAGVMMQFAQYEREIIGERTKVALAAAKAGGTRLGALPQIAPEVEGDILDMWERGYSLAKIARTLTERGVPTVRGGAWAGSTIGYVLKRLRTTDHICSPDHECVGPRPDLSKLTKKGKR